MTETEIKRRKAICEAAHVDEIDDVSDGFHTFRQLYYQRMMLFATIVKQNKDKAWKSLRHEDGELCFGGGWFIVGIDTPEVVREKTKECADMFNILKVKVGSDHDKEMIETIREVTDLPIAVDANQGWKDKEYALEMIHWLKEHGIVMVEQPMPINQLDDTAWVTERSPLPIFADESCQRLKDVAGLQGAFHGINIKLMKCTGMREAWKMVNFARALGMKVMVGCMTETSCAVSAAAQLSPAVDFADLDGNLLISNDRFEGMLVVDGKITLPDRPGIGVTLT